MTRRDRTLWIWLDLETTGIDPATGQILEVGVIVTTPQLEEKGRYTAVVAAPGYTERRDVDEYVVRMHARSGLDRDLLSAERSSAKVCAELRAKLAGLVRQGHNLKLAGWSVHFDRAWLQHHWPHVAALCSHQLVDVSAILEVESHHRPSVAEAMRQAKGWTAHRALEDCESAIRALKAWMGS